MNHEYTLKWRDDMPYYTRSIGAYTILLHQDVEGYWIDIKSPYTGERHLSNNLRNALRFIDKKVKIIKKENENRRYLGI